MRVVLQKALTWLNTICFTSVKNVEKLGGTPLFTENEHAVSDKNSAT